MTERVLFGSVALSAALVVVVLDAVFAEQAMGLAGPLGDLLQRGSLVPIVAAIVAVGGAIELDRLFRAKGAAPHLRFACFFSALFMLAPWLSAAGWLGSGPEQTEGLYGQIAVLILATVGGAGVVVARRQPINALRDLAATMTIILIMGFMGSFAIQIRCGIGSPDRQGLCLLVITILTIKASDMGAYFVGSAIGRHPLIPSISPGKSVEGAIGGIAASVAFALFITKAPAILAAIAPTAVLGTSPDDLGLLGLVDDFTRQFSVTRDSDLLGPVARAALFGVCMSMIGQIGDLIESCFKRDAGIKDSGAVLPQLGGILDVIDSPILAVPVAWWLLTSVWGVI